ncbi:MAG: hypothetical protein ACOYLO_14345 [Ferruginibacter sp.]
MVTEEINKEIVGECNLWYATLASYSEKINRLKKELYFFAPGKTDHEVLLGIEHFHNQIHIQLINIHDLKHEIKYHIKEAERYPRIGHRIPHHYIKEKLDLLIADLDKMETDFQDFVKK